MKKYIFSSLIVLLFTVGGFTSPIFAETTNDDLVQTLQEQVSALLAQIQSLQTQLVEVIKQQGELRSELSAVRNELRLQLHEGLSNEEVTLLQELLAEDSTIYPEGLVTGYFGPLTKNAVKNFQKKYGIEQVGEVGPITRAKLNEFIRGKSGKTPPGLSKKFDFTNDDDDEDGDNNDDEDVDEGPGVGKVRICHKGKNTIHVGIPATMAHLNHGDSIGTCGDNEDDDNDDNDNDTDTTSPIITNVSSSDIGTSTVSVTWNTDENSDSKVWYSTTTPVVLDTSSNTESNSNLVLSHSVEVTGLSTSTTYYYVVESSDSSSNTATSSESSFTTLEEVVADTTSPVISSLTSANIASTSASITWNTDENSDSKVYYDTLSGFLVSSTTPMVSDASMTTSHDLSLTSLTASSTYYYIAVSTDSSGNTATSSEGMLETLSE